MSVRIEMEEGWIVALHRAEAEFFAVQLGPDITDDAKRYCPVDTGRLERSLDNQVIEDEGDGLPELQVGSFPDEDGDVEYAAAVDRGYHGRELVREHMRRSKNGVEHVVREHTRQANQRAQPYLSTALYQERYR
jgi:hypothetical protein